MKNLIPITAFFLVAGLHAQEVEIDPIAAEVFADDIVPPDTGTLPEAEVPEVPEDPVPEAPSDEQTVPVAEDDAALADDAEEDVTLADDAEETSPADDSVQDYSDPGLMAADLPPDATAEEELIYQYDRYLTLMRDGVYDEADSVAKRVVELALDVRGPKSTDFSKALTNLAIVQHRTHQFDAAQQNFQSAIEIIENNEDRLNGELINPLKGLGAAQLEIGRPDLASATFRRAAHVSQVNDGPHNLEQISILESLAETHLRLGLTDDARQFQDMIYALNEREFAANELEMVPSLMRRADWQLRAGFVNDHRTTLRRAVRIIETKAGVDDIRLVVPLTKLGQSYFYIDVSTTQALAQNTMLSGEVYFKRALRIASESPDPDWEMIAGTSLALGDYYMFQGNEQRARKVYKQSWRTLSEGEERLAFRAEQLEQVVTLRENPIQRYVSAPVKDTTTGKVEPMLQGNITISYEVSSRGHATNLKIVESQPGGFSDMERLVQREMRSRIFRPRFVDEEAVATDGQILIHRFYYSQEDLDAVKGESSSQATKPAAESKTETATT